MEEVQIKSSNLTEDSLENKNPKHKGSQSDALQNIYRKGDRIYHAYNENISMVKETSSGVEDLKEKEPRQDETAPRESRFKSFSFENQISPEDQEKCISFWRSIVEKRLEPIKCSLINKFNENKTKSIHKNSAESYSSQRRHSKSKQCSKEQVQNESSRTAPENNVWYSILRELQKRKLHETKLMMEKNCRFCNYLRNPFYEGQLAEEQNEQLIKEIDRWQPTSTPKNDSRSSKSFRFSNERRSNASEPQNIDLSEYVTNEQPNEINPKRNSDSKLENIKLVAGKMKHVDMIENKKKQGEYTKWRKNKLPSCKCQRPECDCNENPAIKYFTESTGIGSSMNPTSISVSSENLEGNSYVNIKNSNATEIDVQPFMFNDNKKGDVVIINNQSPSEKPEELGKNDVAKIHESTSNNTDEHMNELFIYSKGESMSLTQMPVNINTPPPRRSILVLPEEGKKRKASRKSISVKLQCICDYTECDCTHLAIIPEKSVLSEEKAVSPEPVKRRQSVARVDSIELYRNKLGSSVNEKIENSDQ